MQVLSEIKFDLHSYDFFLNNFLSHIFDFCHIYRGKPETKPSAGVPACLPHHRHHLC